jgi:hypothetical protein
MYGQYDREESDCRVGRCVTDRSETHAFGADRYRRYVKAAA